MPAYEYAWAAGHDVALLSLTNVETALLPYTAGNWIAPKTNPVNLFPVRLKVLSKRETGSGTPQHVWNFAALQMAALDYIIDTFLMDGSTELVSAPVTISTRRHERLGYARFNAYMHLPVPEQDYTQDNGFAMNLQLRFSITELLA